MKPSAPLLVLALLAGLAPMSALAAQGPIKPPAAEVRPPTLGVSGKFVGRAGAHGTVGGPVTRPSGVDGSNLPQRRR